VRKNDVKRSGQNSKLELKAKKEMMTCNSRLLSINKVELKMNIGNVHCRKPGVSKHNAEVL
jgi:transcription elongation factor Elf1